jgi:hypothetical protein
MQENAGEQLLNANNENAHKGGVKTPEGKLVVRFNARTHGILANLVAEYENDFYKNYLNELFTELQPQSVIENVFVERIALHYLKLFRLAKAESEFMKNCLQSNMMFQDLSSRLPESLAPMCVDQMHIQRLAEIYCRYEVAIENRLYRAIKELKEYRRQKSHE